MATVAFWFGLETADGGLQAAFSQLTLSSEVEPLGGEGGTGSDPPEVRWVRPTVTLGRIQNDDRGLFAWHETVVSSGIAAARKDCTVTVFDASGRTVAKYELNLAFSTASSRRTRRRFLDGLRGRWPHEIRGCRPWRPARRDIALRYRTLRP